MPGRYLSNVSLLVLDDDMRKAEIIRESDAAGLELMGDAGEKEVPRGHDAMVEVVLEAGSACIDRELFLAFIAAGEIADQGS